MNCTDVPLAIVVRLIALGNVARFLHPRFNLGSFAQNLIELGLEILPELASPGSLKLNQI